MNLMGNRKGIVGLALLAAGVLAAGGSAAAQEAQGDSGQPARAARLSYVDGQVELSQGDQIMTDKAVANTPLFEGTQLTTADDGKAEIQFEDGSVARIAPDSSLTLSVLRGSGASGDAELTLDAGLAYFEFQGGGQAGRFDVYFGSSAISTSGFTALRVSMDTPPGDMAVFSGNAHLEIGGVAGAVEADLHGGESIVLNPYDPSNYSMADSIEPNSWDAWNSDRDEELTAEASQRTEAPADLGDNTNPAWNDLDANGSWYDVPDQGYVWSPYDAANPGFDPYGNGNWSYTPSYGYVWVSGYPWGYLPFQCGAWNFYPGFGWGWSPGAGSPWWRHGGYRGPNVGNTPVGYRPVSQPIPPRRPVGRPVPLIHVDRHPPVDRHPLAAGTAFPARDRNTPVTIAGNPVQAMRPLPSRPVYAAEGFASGGNRPGPGAFGTPQPGIAMGQNRGQNMGQNNMGQNTGLNVGRGMGQPLNPRSIYGGGQPVGQGQFAPVWMPPPVSRPQTENRSFAPRYAPPRPAGGGAAPGRPSGSSGAPRQGGGGGYQGGGGGYHGGGGGYRGGGGGGVAHGGGGGGGWGGGGHH